MMKTLKLFILGLFISLSVCSCEISSYATTQDDIYIETSADIVHSTIDYNIVFRYGTPYYYDGRLLYYLYDGLYYYPYFYDNYWYLRCYRRPFNHLYYRPYFRPHRYDYRFNNNFRPYHNWRYDNRRGYRSNQNVSRPYRNYPNNRITPNNRPNIGSQSRPQQRPNTGVNRGSSPRIGGSNPGSRGGSFGGGSRGKR